MGSDVWAAGDRYESYVGRWSRLVADRFVRWLDLPPGRRWLDVGCGTGALTSTARALAAPVRIVGVDPSPGFLATGRAHGNTLTAAADARALPLPDGRFDAVVSALVLNFVPGPERALAEFVRVSAPGATVAAYVWDYAAGMEMMRYFWDAAAALDPEAAGLDEGRRFSICRPGPLRRLWTEAGLREVDVEPIDIPMVFADFDEYWRPFLGATGPAPAYVAKLPDDRRDALRDLLRSRLPQGRIELTARAWAVRGVRPDRPSGR